MAKTEEQLANLRKARDNLPSSLVAYQYAGVDKETGGETYCVIGYLEEILNGRS